MSRIGKKPIEIVKGVEVKIDGQFITVKGPKGELSLTCHERISASVDGSILTVSRSTDEQQDRALHGLTRSLIQNMVTGVSKGYEKRLEIQGVGYRAMPNGNSITLNLGFSHPIELKAFDGVKVDLDKDTKQIVVSGIDKQRVGEFAANIRALKKPEPYKGKGIRYAGENVRRKAGKTASK